MKFFFYFICILFVAWISFFPQSVHEHYAVYLKTFLAVLFLILLMHKKGARFLFNREDIYLWLFLGWQAFSVLFAHDKQIAWQGCLNFITPFIILYFIFKEELDFNKARVILFALFFSGIIVSAIGMLEFIFNKSMIYEHLIKNMFYARYRLESRMMSTMMHPVIAGTYLMCCLPISYYIVGALKGRKRLFAILGTVVIISGLIFTFTRMSWLAALITAILYIIKKNMKLFPVLIISCLLIFISIAAIVKTSPVLTDRVEYRKVVDYIMKGYRLDRYGVTFKMAKAHPLSGVGFNNYSIVFDDYYSDWIAEYEYKISDNMYLRMLGESGVVGFTLFILFIFSMLRKGMICLKNDKERDRDIKLVFILILAGILIHMLSYDLFYWATPFYLFLLSLGAVSGRWDHENA